MQFFVTNAEKSISFKVEHQCPQCGAPITLGEEALFFTCGFCRVRSCISQKGFPRYMFSLSIDAPTDSEVIYLPYWRFKGVRFACHNSGVEHRFLDISALAVEGSHPIPFSLGLRSQALPLKRISGETRGKFIRPAGFKATLQASDRRARSVKKNKPPVFLEDIGETTSLIYSPFYIQKGRFFDGILNKPIQAVVPGDIDVTALNLCRPGKDTLFVSGICPGCGWDLEGHVNSMVLICRNCQTLWKTRGSKLGKIRYGCAKPSSPDDVMIPFWKIKSAISPIAMATYADLLRMGNLPKAIQPGWEKKSLYFWAPAFKIRPKIFLELNTRFAIAQPDPPLENKIRKNIHLPITLASSEAIQSIKITLASLMRPRTDHLPGLPGTRIVPEDIRLVFLPFEPRPHDYFHPDLNLAINKNILALSGNL
jgi:hypothetical protein